jgi:hypothetical protein
VNLVCEHRSWGHWVGASIRGPQARSGADGAPGGSDASAGGPQTGASPVPPVLTGGENNT